MCSEFGQHGTHMPALVAVPCMQRTGMAGAVLHESITKANRFASIMCKL